MGLEDSFIPTDVNSKDFTEITSKKGSEFPTMNTGLQKSKSTNKTNQYRFFKKLSEKIHNKI